MFIELQYQGLKTHLDTIDEEIRYAQQIADSLQRAARLSQQDDPQACADMSQGAAKFLKLAAHLKERKRVLEEIPEILDTSRTAEAENLRAAGRRLAGMVS